MSANVSRPSLVATLIVALAGGACSVLNGYDPIDAAPGGGGGVGGSGEGGASSVGAGGTGGELPTCNDAACEAGSSECTSCSCLQGLVCDCDPMVAGASCDGNRVCDGAGNCVDCLMGVMDCPDNLSCDQTTCVSADCADGMFNGLETDIDCGGPGCAPCAVGDSCLVPEDCSTIHCDQGVCLPCADQADCGASLFCAQRGTCTPKKENFFPCTENYECISGVCTQYGNLMACN